MLLPTGHSMRPQGCGGRASLKVIPSERTAMLGIDVSKHTLACALYDPAHGRFQWERSVPHTPAGLKDLLASTPPEVAWVMEPTGRFSLAVAQVAQAAGRKALLAPTRKAKRYLASLQDRAKCDRLDSRGLALFGASRPDASLVPLPDQDPRGGRIRPTPHRPAWGGRCPDQPTA